MILLVVPQSNCESFLYVFGEIGTDVPIKFFSLNYNPIFSSRLAKRTYDHFKNDGRKSDERILILAMVQPFTEIGESENSFHFELHIMIE